MNPVAKTALLVAATRALEHERADRLFEDPFAARLAGDDGRAVFAAYAGSGPRVPVLEVRTRWFDEALLAAVHAPDSPRQVVIVAAGMDARAYRLPWPAGTKVFELDQPDMLAAKRERLGPDVTPRAERVALGVDLAGDWSSKLTSSGFDASQPSVWLVEGLLQYLPEDAVLALFARIDALTARGSTVLFDLVGKSMMAIPPLQPLLAMMKELGAPWIYGNDDPASLLPRSWKLDAIDPGIVGNEWKRWPFPVPPMNVPNVPRGFLVRATR